MTEQNHIKISGVIPPVVTPLTQNKQLDLRTFEKQLHYLVKAGVDAVFVLGTCGEGYGLTRSQKRELLKGAVDAVDSRVPVLAGVLEPSTARVLEELDRTIEAGISAVVVTTPYYYQSDASDQIHHFRTIARASSVPIITYNIPSHTQNTITPETVTTLLDEENIIAIKDSTEDWALFEALLALRDINPNFSVLQGSEKNAAKALLAGADGIVPSAGNLVPSLFVELVKAVHKNDTVRVNNLDQQINDLTNLYTHGFWLACLKYGLTLVDRGTGETLSHHQSLTESAKTQIRDLVEHYALN